MRALCAIALLASGCATISTDGMSQPCKDGYQLCLDNCPKPPPNLTGDPSNASLDFDTPSCVQRCNDDAKKCK